MHRNKITFIGIWLVLVVLLFFLPGFEARGLAFGLIVGYWPFLIFTGFEHGHPSIVLLIMFILSGAFVVLCSMLMDKAGGYMRFAFLLLALMILLGSFCFHTAISYKQWRNMPVIAQAMDSEFNYQASKSDYHRTIVIPRTIAGFQLGLYLASACGGLLSAIILLVRKCNLYKIKLPPNEDDSIS